MLLHGVRGDWNLSAGRRRPVTATDKNGNYLANASDTSCKKGISDEGADKRVIARSFIADYDPNGMVVYGHVWGRTGLSTPVHFLTEHNPCLIKGVCCFEWHGILLISSTYARKQISTVLLLGVSVSWYRLEESVSFQYTSNN